MANFYLTKFHCKKITSKVKVSKYFSSKKRKRKSEKLSKLNFILLVVKFFVAEFSLSVLPRFFVASGQFSN